MNDRKYISWLPISSKASQTRDNLFFANIVLNLSQKEEI